MERKNIILASIITILIVSLTICFFLLYNHNKKINKKIELYSVTFMVDKEEYKVESNIKNGDLVKEPQEPIKKGYKFLGWYQKDEKFNFNKPITSNITLLSKWKKINEETGEELPTYIVKFDTDGGSEIENQEVALGDKVERPINPTKKGYEFVDWTLSNETFDFESVISEDIILVAVWNKKEEQIIEQTTTTKKNKYTVTFNTDGGSYVKSQTVEEMKNATMPANPKKTGYTFLNWYLGDAIFDFNTTITQDITLVASWQENMTEKTETVEESIDYTTKEEEEQNMLRGTKSIVQNGENGKKKVTYNVLYNSKGQEVSRTFLSEKITLEPKQEIVKIGISDYNINIDTYSLSTGSLCLKADLQIEPITRCTKSLYGEIIYLNINNNIAYYLIKNGDSWSQKINITNLINYDSNSREIIYEDRTYVDIGGQSSSFGIPLTQNDCNDYGLACGQW